MSDAVSETAKWAREALAKQEAAKPRPVLEIEERPGEGLLVLGGHALANLPHIPFVKP